MDKTVLVTGAAGFIGHAVAKRLLAEGWRVVGVDSVNPYYAQALKWARVEDLKAQPGAAERFAFHQLNLIERDRVLDVALAEKPSHIIHLAAQAGVRYGLVNQQAFLESNLIGHFTILQATKALADAGHPVAHLLYASSSSVYGANDKIPFEETDDVSNPVSLYAATKRSDELITRAWAHQFGQPATGLRFFNVYGPWGRPDNVALMFMNNVVRDEEITLYNYGDLWRDFTYIDDIVEAIFRLMPRIPAATPTPHDVFNLGNQNPVQMLAFVKIMEEVVGKPARTVLKEWPPTEVYRTMADTTKLHAAVGWAPSTPLKEGLGRLWAWYGPWMAANPGAI